MTFHLVLLPVLFLLSGFFSASETALFSLRREDRDWLQRRGTGPARSVLDLLDQPRALLVSVLFGNLLVNFLLMAVSAKLVLELGYGRWGLMLGGLLTTISVVVLGEVTPKAVAVTAPRPVALIAGPILLAFRNATRIATTPLGRMVAWGLDLIERRFPPSPGALTDQELKKLVELQAAEGGIEHQASEFLAEALELGSRRVLEVMTPRVDLAALDLSQPEPRQTFMDLVRARRVGKVLVHEGGDLDTIHGYLTTRDVLHDPDRPLDELVRPVWFVPSTKSLESLLREMISRAEPLALVVGEYGGTNGLVTLEDVIEEITGDIARQDASPLLRPTKDGRWQVAGRFPLRELEELLGIRFEIEGATTLSGFVSHQLGRMPEVDDLVWHAGVQFKVGAVVRRRAQEVLVSLPRPGRRAPRTEVSEEMTHSGAHRALMRLQARVAETADPATPAEVSAEEASDPPPAGGGE